jgi:hypothetical protein
MHRSCYKLPESAFPPIILSGSHTTPTTCGRLHLVAAISPLSSSALLCHPQRTSRVLTSLYSYSNTVTRCIRLTSLLLLLPYAPCHASSAHFVHWLTHCRPHMLPNCSALPPLPSQGCPMYQQRICPTCDAHGKGPGQDVPGSAVDLPVPPHLRSLYCLYNCHHLQVT